MSTTLPRPPEMLQITVDVPVEKQEQFQRLWMQTLSDEEAPINQQIRAEDAKREDVLKNGKAALFRLYDVAQGDTGQCRTIVRFLVGLYNGSAYPFDLTDLRALDHSLFADCMAVLHMDARHCVHEVHNYFENGEQRWQKMISDWHLKDRSSY